MTSPRRCIWAHPPAAGKRVIRFRDVTLGTEIDVQGGYSWFLWRDGGRDPVALRVVVDGEVVDESDFRDREGWRGKRIHLHEHLVNRTADVVFEIGSASAKDQHFCFAADVR